MVENLFSVLRALGGTDYRFGALSFIWRLRLFILGAGNDLKLVNSNVLQPQDEKLITQDIAEDLIDGFISPNIIETIEDEIENEDILQMTDFDKDSESVPIVVMSVPDDEFLEEEVENGDSSDDEEDEEESPQRATKRKSPKKGSNFLFDEVEIFDPKSWLNKRNIKLSDILVNDLQTWNSEFNKYHSTAPDGAFSILRTPKVIQKFLSIIKSLNPNKHSESVLKRFASDRTFQRLAHMKNIMKKDRCETARSKKLKTDLQE